MFCILWFLAWIFFGDGVVNVDPMGGWAITGIVLAVVDFTMAIRGDTD